MAQVQQSSFTKWLEKNQAPLSEEKRNKKAARLQKLAQGRIPRTTGLNAKQLQALIGVLNVKQNLHKDIKYNQEFRTIPSGERYIASHKGMQGYTMRMVDPDGEGPLPEFVTVYMNKGKLYSMGGYIPKDESKYDKYREQYIGQVPIDQHKNTKFFDFTQGKEISYGVQHKDGTYNIKQFQQLVPRNHFLATYVPSIANEYKDNNKIEKWGKGEYMAAASAAWKEIQRGLIEEIDPVYDWAGASDEVLKYAASHFKKQIRDLYFATIVEDEDGFVKLMDLVYKQVADNAIAQARRKKQAGGVMDVD
ncbi:MAG: hypothetical protein EZS28_020312 [Streblomastix strix]|uniref:Uncharacterized protein n=1 Tax=Streblomastix strix TaxID=222440 RepID=A0A5J4VNP1_9EUKA|nr:MAG: hypothetical protein EZS28_020312 [Streblomastix strix]